MSKKKLVTICICVGLAVLIAAGACLYFFTDIFKPSVASVLGYKDKEITRIVIKKYDATAEITDKATIDEILMFFDGAVVTEQEEIKNVYGSGPSPILTLYAGDERVCQFDFFGTLIRRYDEDVTQMDNRTNYKRTALTINKTIQVKDRDAVLNKYLPEIPEQETEVENDQNVESETLPNNN